jgi:hypothetical protein
MKKYTILIDFNHPSSYLNEENIHSYGQYIDIETSPKGYAYFSSAIKANESRFYTKEELPEALKKAQQTNKELHKNKNFKIFVLKKNSSKFLKILNKKILWNKRTSSC